MNDRLSVTLQPMRMADIQQVVQIDKISFPIPWPAHSYRYELTKNHNSRMFVLHPPGPTDSANGRSLRNLLGGWMEAPSPDKIIGYSGLWILSDEVHISTVGILPDWRGRYLGELLFFAMLRHSLRIGARITTLEVRTSNEVAINLYRKYAFDITGRRPGYYRDNGEDAWIMTVQSGQNDYHAQLEQLGAALFQHIDVIDKCREVAT